MKGSILRAARQHQSAFKRLKRPYRSGKSVPIILAWFSRRLFPNANMLLYYLCCCILYINSWSIPGQALLFLRKLILFLCSGAFSSDVILSFKASSLFFHFSWRCFSAHPVCYLLFGKNLLQTFMGFFMNDLQFFFLFLEYGFHFGFLLGR